MREGGAGENAATGSFRTSWLSDEVKTTIHSVEYSIRRSCALWYCAGQSLYDRIPSVQDRASCLPESSRRALVADAREIRQYQMHPSSPLRKRDGHPVRRASFFSPGATFAGVLRMRPLKYFRLNSPHPHLWRPGLHGDGTIASRKSPLRISPRTFKCRPSACLQIARGTPNELASQVFLGHAASALFQRRAEHPALLT